MLWNKQSRRFGIISDRQTIVDEFIKCFTIDSDRAFHQGKFSLPTQKERFQHPICIQKYIYIVDASPKAHGHMLPTASCHPDTGTISWFCSLFQLLSQQIYENFVLKNSTCGAILGVKLSRCQTVFSFYFNCLSDECRLDGVGFYWTIQIQRHK